MKSKQITESSVNDLIFDANSGEWWVENGAFKALHSFNLIRIKFLTDAIYSYSNKTLKSQKILDVGCGGGIFCEPLARLGANVTGIDTNKKAIQSANNHAKSQNLKIKYLNTNLAGINNEKKFDYLLIVILNSEYSLESIIELTWEDFFSFKRFNKRMNNYNISLTKKLFEKANIVFDSKKTSN